LYHLGDKHVAHRGSEKWLENLTDTTSEGQDRRENMKMDLGE